MKASATTPATSHIHIRRRGCGLPRMIHVIRITYMHMYDVIRLTILSCRMKASATTPVRYGTTMESQIRLARLRLQRAPLLPYDKQQREIALEMMRSTGGLMPDADIASMWGPKKSRETMERLEKIESVLAAADGDFFLGDTFSMVPCIP